MKINDGESIVFIGDSVTDCGRKRPYGNGLWEGTGNGYVRLIESFLVAFYPELNISVTNMGTNGNTSYDLINRFDKDAIELKPDHLIICIGINDVWRHFDEPTVKMNHNHVPLDEYKDNLLKMVNKAKENNIDVLLMTPYYLETNKEDLMRKMMDEYSAKVKEVAKETNVDCIDLQAAFENILKYRYPASITWDRIHPGYSGGMIIAKEYLKYIGFDFNRLK